MSEEITTPVEGGQVEETTVQELELGPEGDTTKEEGTIELPSDVEDFVMPEKMQGKSAEEIAKMYVELEKFKASKGEVPAEETPTEETPEEVDTLTKYTQEFLQEGKLSDEAYEALEKEGMSRQDIDDKMEFEAYKSKKAVDELVEVIGGIENFTAMDTWAQENLGKEKVAEYSQELAGASKFAKQAILKVLYGQYQAAQNGEEPTADVVHTNETQGVVTKGYTAQHELQADMADPRYGVDRSYTKAVEEKLAKSKITW